MLHPEQDDLQPVTAIVLRKHYRKLQELEHLGGFKRFGLSLYSDDEHRQKPEIDKVLAFLQPVFANHALIESYFK